MEILKHLGEKDGQFADNLAGQVYKKGELLMWSSGDLIPATSAATVVEGLSLEAIPTTDPRYSVAGQINYDRLKECDEFVMDVTGAVITAAVPGTAYDLSDSQTVNLAATTNKVVMFIRAEGSRGIFAIPKRSRTS